jgi:cell division protein FtsQ
VNEGKPGKVLHRAAVIGGILIAAAIIVLYTPWVRVFDLRRIVVKGNYSTPVEQIRDSSGIQEGVGLLRAPLTRARDLLLQLPWVMEVNFRRLFPHTLEVTVRERSPIALITDHNQSKRPIVLGEDGVIIGYTQEVSSDFVWLTGVTISEAASGRKTVTSDIVDAVCSLDRQGLGSDLFPRIDFSDPDAVIMYTSDEGEVILGPLSQIEDRIDELAALLNTIELENYQTIDLRFGGEAILVPRKVVNR